MPDKAFLIVSLSGRILAKAAARSGQPAVGMDAFADRDTCGLALEWVRVPLDAGWNVEPAAMLAAADAICPKDRCLGLVYGSGFEARPDLLRRLAGSRPLLGNTPEVLETVANPTRFFALLDQFGIPHPQVSTQRPTPHVGWLSKKAGASGGTHVCSASIQTGNEAGRYFQRAVLGENWSLLFLANGQGICPVGFNRALLTPPQAPGPWSYAGAVRQAQAPALIGEAVVDAARALTCNLGLKGLNGLDFIITEKGWTLLELNPRPTATLELWDVPPLPPLFDLHMQACLGRLPVGLPQPEGAMAVAVTYAETTMCVPASFPWPNWSADLPQVGCVLQMGEPVCTVHAGGADGTEVEQQALGRRQTILDRLAIFRPGDNYHPPRHETQATVT